MRVFTTSAETKDKDKKSLDSIQFDGFRLTNAAISAAPTRPTVTFRTWEKSSFTTHQMSTLQRRHR
jgi:hypothetical protein